MHTWLISSSGTCRAVDGSRERLPMLPTITPVPRPRPTHLTTRLPLWRAGARVAVVTVVEVGAVVVVLLFRAVAPLVVDVAVAVNRLQK